MLKAFDLQSIFKAEMINFCLKSNVILSDGFKGDAC